MDFSSLHIPSPKRPTKRPPGWEGFFPYYAGYPEAFAEDVLRSCRLAETAVVFDPWNGSGTTLRAAAKLGLDGIGLDLNPVMVVVARARLLQSSEADSLLPLAHQVLSEARLADCDDADPLLEWFDLGSVRAVRGIELSIRGHLVGALTITPKGARLEHLSGMAATNYVALFSVLRDLTVSFGSTNPTWLRHRRANELQISVSHEDLAKRFIAKIEGMSAALLSESNWAATGTRAEIRLGNATDAIISAGRADLVLTSPPYCTRIDYTAATRAELSLLEPVLGLTRANLRDRMIGSTKVPKTLIEPSEEWGSTCLEFINKVRKHPSRASAGYYYLTHVDYFDKMHRSMRRIAAALQPGGAAILVVQDSRYKEVHNDVPTIIAEMGSSAGLKLRRREDFFSRRSMASLNKKSRKYGAYQGATESVLCFQRA